MANKFKSWALWVSIGAFVVWIVSLFGVDINSQMSEALNLICPIVMAFGVVNNPNDREKF